MLTSFVKPENVDEETLLAVEMTILCKQLKTLPRSGGLLEQDWYHVALLKAGLSAIAKKEEREIEESRRKAEQSR